MSIAENIVVTGAAGQLGSLVIAELQRKVPRARLIGLVRKPATAADLAARGIELRAVSYDDPESLAAALAAGTPQWSLLGIAHLEQLPGVRWKLHNPAQLQKTDARRFAEQADLLAARLAALSWGWLMMS